MDYAVIVLARNAASTVKETLNSILGQTSLPAYVCVVDDGSTDTTPRILDRFLCERRSTFSIVSLPDLGYDIRRVPANLNTAYARLEAEGARFEYSMITGDDCIFPEDYSETILAEMERDPKLAIASGDWGIRGSPDAARIPQGAGRFILEEFWSKVGRRYPIAYGWETWLVFKALQLGCRVDNLAWLKYQHLRVSGSSHRFRYWGKAMRALGYHPLMALGRIGKNMLYRTELIPLSGSLSMLAAYLFQSTARPDPYGHEYEPSLRIFVREYQAMRISSFVSKRLSKILVDRHCAVSM